MLIFRYDAILFILFCIILIRTLTAEGNQWWLIIFIKRFWFIKILFKKKNFFLTFHRRKRFEIYIIENRIEKNGRTINNNPSLFPPFNGFEYFEFLSKMEENERWNETRHDNFDQFTTFVHSSRKSFSHSATCTKFGYEINPRDTWHNINNIRYRSVTFKRRKIWIGLESLSCQARRKRTVRHHRLRRTNETNEVTR